MPSQNQSADRSERERFPEVAEEIGEDPARWLDHDMLKQTLVRQEVDPNSEFGQMRLVEDNDKNSTFGKMFRARVRGIDKLFVIRKWLEVEHELDRGPRHKQVIEPLKERAQDLKENGERSHYLPLKHRDYDRDLAPVDGPELDQRTAGEKIATDGGRDE